MEGTFEGKVAVVTGSTSGIGLAISEALAARGARIVVNGRSDNEEVRKIADSLPEAIYVAGDVGDEQACARMVAAAVDTWGRLDILVNNAGTTRRIPLDDLESATLEVWQEIFATNLFGAWNMTRAAVGALRESQGSVINMSSVAGLRPVGSSVPYSVSKAALNQLTMVLAAALGPEITVNAIAPGMVETRWTDGWDEVKKMIADAVPLRRNAQADEIANACVALLECTFVTGAIVPVDGGEQLV